MHTSTLTTDVDITATRLAMRRRVILDRRLSDGLSDEELVGLCDELELAVRLLRAASQTLHTRIPNGK